MIERNDPLGMQPLAMEDMMGLGPAIEIEIENPDDVSIGIDGVEIDLMPGEDEPVVIAHGDNLADMLDEDVINKMASDLMAEVDGDKQSRKQWIDIYAEGLDVLGLDIEDRSEPWEGACGLVHPMMIEAAVRFQSETITEVFPSSGPVATKIIGRETPERKAAANRVKEDMNYRLTEQMPEYRPDHERMLFTLALAGSAFKKVYFDGSLGRQASVFIPPEDFIMSYGATSMMTVHRKTHVMRKTKNEVKKLQKSGFYRDVSLPDPVMEMDEIQEKKAEKQGAEALDDDRHMLYEIHCELTLEGDEDDIAKPYVVTIDRSSNIVLSVYRNWLEEDPLMLPRSYFVNYEYVPGFGAYGFGLIHLVGALAKGATSIMRQLVDAGTLSNLPGGLKSRGLRIKGGDTPISPGEFRDVDVASGTVRDNIMPLPYKEPSQVLLALFNGIAEEGRRMAATADLKISDMNANAPVGTTLALLERQLKVMSAVQARVHNAMKEEFKLLKAVIRDNILGGYEYQPDTGEQAVQQADYDMVEVIPVSDPNASTMSQRIAQVQAVVQLSGMAPTVYDLAQLHRTTIELIGFPNADKIVPLPDDKTRVPRDPISENAGFLVSQPAKAFAYQDHKAHIAVHMSFLQDPANAMVFQGPQGQALPPAIMAHVQEHMAMDYKNTLQQMTGIQFPANEDEGMPPEMERQLAQMLAGAAQQLTAQNQQAAQQQANQQAAQDPVLQLQDREAKIKEMEVQRKAMNDQYDREVALERVALERERLEREDLRSNRKMDADNNKAILDLRLRAEEMNQSAKRDFNRGVTEEVTGNE